MERIAAAQVLQEPLKKRNICVITLKSSSENVLNCFQISNHVEIYISNGYESKFYRPTFNIFISVIQVIYFSVYSKFKLKVILSKIQLLLIFN